MPILLAVVLVKGGGVACFSRFAAAAAVRSKRGFNFVGVSEFLLRILANWRRALRVASPASSVGRREGEGRLVRIVIMSRAACRKNDAMVTVGKGISCGKKTIVSESASSRALGM